MRSTIVSMLGLALLLSASSAFALAGGGGQDDPVATSGSVVRTSAKSTQGGSVATTSEPLALFVVGIGLLGAHFLRRR
jgi:hypothetical protein